MDDSDYIDDGTSEETGIEDGDEDGKTQVFFIEGNF